MNDVHKELSPYRAYITYISIGDHKVGTVFIRLCPPYVTYYFQKIVNVIHQVIILMQGNELCAPLHNVVKLVAIGRTAMHGLYYGYITIRFMHRDQLPRVQFML